jgi:hypothetical protein
MLALQIWYECNDEYHLQIIAHNIFRFFLDTNDESFLLAVAQVFGATLKELREAIEGTKGNIS